LEYAGAGVAPGCVGFASRAVHLVPDLSQGAGQGRSGASLRLKLGLQVGQRGLDVSSSLDTRAFSISPGGFDFRLRLGARAVDLVPSLFQSLGKSRFRGRRGLEVRPAARRSRRLDLGVSLSLRGLHLRLELVEHLRTRGTSRGQSLIFSGASEIVYQRDEPLTIRWL
jgi:hypothetical protein